MMRLLSAGCVVLCVVAGLGGVAVDARADETVVRIVPLKFVSAAFVAALFGTGTKTDPVDLSADRKEFVRRAAIHATRDVRPVPQMIDPGLYPFPDRGYAEVKVAQGAQFTGEAGGRKGGGFSALLPEGLSEPPTALPHENALLVRGTPEAIDQFREIVSLLDQQPKQVNIELKLVNLTQSLTREWGNDIDWLGRNRGLSAHGPAPVGPTLRYGTADLNVLTAVNQVSGRSNNTVAANVTTTNNTACVIRAATAIPFVAASVTYDAFGQRHVDYQVDVVLTGVELFTIPRVNADDTITMFLRPSFIDKAGEVVGPDGSVIPITQEVRSDTMVTVRDGETLLIGGFPRSVQSLETVGLPIILRQGATIEDSESLLFVTPRIVRALGQ